MRYKLIGDNNTDDVISTILKNRGVKSPSKYLNLDESVVQDYNDLDNIQDAVQCFIKHYEQKNKIAIIPDEDADGYTSSAMLWLYIKSLDEDYPIQYFMHERPKQHGLADIDLSLFNDVKLLIIADASTNDALQCNKLIDHGIDVCVLDHHDANYSDEDETKVDYNTIEQNKAIIVNNQLSKKYTNKNLSGAGIVYRFLQALDDALWECHADDFINLCCLGNIADVMDMRSFETRYITNAGIECFLNNKFLESLANAQSFSTKGIINIHNIAWYFAPVLNSVTRLGTIEERDLIFRAMTEQYDEFDYKRRDGSIVKENIYDRAARIAKNIKARQDKQRDVVFNELIKCANTDDKVVILESKNAQSGLVGLSCMKLSDTLKKPVIVLKEIEKDGRKILSGSCRNFDNSPIKDLKEIINQTNAFEFCSGHGNAAGLAILPENLELAKMKFKEILKDVDFDTAIQCDFVIDIDNLSIGFIQEIDKLNWLWCTGIKEPVVCIENIRLTRDQINLQGKNHDSVAFTINDIKFVQFKLSDGDPIYDFMNDWGGNEDDAIKLNIIGECSINTYKGICTPQIMIKDCMTIE